MTTAKSSARPQQYSRSRVIGAFVAVYIVWGSTYLAIRYAVRTMPPFLMVGTRFMASGALLYAWSRLRGEHKPTTVQWRDASVTGFLLLCCGNGAVAWAEQRVPSGLAALLVAIVPLWVVVLDWFRPHGTRPKLSVVAGVIVGLVGLVVLVGPNTITGEGVVDRAAAWVLIAGSLAWAAGSVYNRYGAQDGSAVMATGLQMLAGSVFLVVVGIVMGEPRALHPEHISSVSWIGWLYLVTFGSLLGFTAYIYLLRAVSPAKASTYAYVNPVVAVFLGWAVAGEPITARTLLAAAIILGGVAMISLTGGRAAA
jgi:drug/metabolite transporter (DMT)-like permease